MVKYLYLDPVDDKLNIPSLTFTKIELDIVIETVSNYGKIIGLPYDFVLQNYATSNELDYNNTHVTSLTKDGVVQADRAPISLNTRHKYVADTVSKTSATYIFNHNGNTSQVSGKVYSVKYYNGAVLVAHYDMNTGTVQDQSGNGNHATLIGGTWAEEASTSEPVIHTGASLLSAGASITATGSRATTGAAGLSAGASLAASGSRTIAGTASLSGGASSASTGLKTVQGDAALSAGAGMFASGNKIVSGTTSVKAGASLSADAKRTATGASAFSAGASVTGAGSKAGTDVGAALSGGASLTAQGNTRIQGAASFSGGASIQADVTGTGKSVSGAASFSAGAALHSVGLKKMRGSATVKSGASIHAAGLKRIRGQAALSGGSSFTSTGKRIVSAQVRVSGGASITASFEVPAVIVETIRLSGRRDLYIYLNGGLRMVERQDISLVAGSSKIIEITITGIDDLTGATAEFVCDEINKAAVIQDGKVVVELLPADTAQLAGLMTYHQVWVTDYYGHENPIARGMLKIS